MIAKLSKKLLYLSDSSVGAPKFERGRADAALGASPLAAAGATERRQRHVRNPLADAQNDAARRREQVPQQQRRPRTERAHRFPTARQRLHFLGNFIHVQSTTFPEYSTTFPEYPTTFSESITFIESTTIVIDQCPVDKLQVVAYSHDLVLQSESDPVKVSTLPEPAPLEQLSATSASMLLSWTSPGQHIISR